MANRVAFAAKTFRMEILGNRHFGTLGRRIVDQYTLPVFDMVRHMSTVPGKTAPPCMESSGKYSHSHINTSPQTRIRHATNSAGITTSAEGSTENNIDFDMHSITFGMPPFSAERIDAATGNLVRLVASSMANRTTATTSARVVSSILSATPSDMETAIRIAKKLFEETLHKDSTESTDERQEPIALEKFSTELEARLQLFQETNIKEDSVSATDSLREWIFDKSQGGISRFNHKELSKIMQALYDSGEYDLIVELMDNSHNEYFKRDAANITLYCKANLMSTYCNPSLVEAVATVMRTHLGSNDEIMGMVHTTRANIAHLLIADLMKKKLQLTVVRYFNRFIPDVDPLALKEVKACYQRYLSEALVCYKKAFIDTRRPQQALVVIHHLLEADCTSEATRDELIQFARLTKSVVSTDESVVEFPFALARLETHLILNPSDMINFIKYGMQLVKACDSIPLLRVAFSSAMELKGFSHSLETQAKAEELLTILRHKYRSLQKKDNIPDTYYHALFCL
ncbi:MAG: hypothetical protein HY860_04440 [Chlamydiales bacterium]|nr:hypothetical protein [Chlamydiales bacterium]